MSVTLVEQNEYTGVLGGKLLVPHWETLARCNRNDFLIYPVWLITPIEWATLQLRFDVPNRKHPFPAGDPVVSAAAILHLLKNYYLRPTERLATGEPGPVESGLALARLLGQGNDDDAVRFGQALLTRIDRQHRRFELHFSVHPDDQRSPMGLAMLLSERCQR